VHAERARVQLAAEEELTLTMYQGRQHHRRRNEADGCRSIKERKQLQEPLLFGSDRRTTSLAQGSSTAPSIPLSPADSLEPPRATPETLSVEDCSSPLHQQCADVNSSTDTGSLRRSNSRDGEQSSCDQKSTKTGNGDYFPSVSSFPHSNMLNCGQEGDRSDTANEVDHDDDDVEGGNDCEEEDCGHRKPAWNDLIRVNVSGQKFDFRRSILERHPKTLLGNPEKRRYYYDARRGEYFFDRHRPSFEAIFSYYQYGGRLRRPHQVADDVFLAEVMFHEIETDVVMTYKKSEGYSEEELVLPDDRKLQVRDSDNKRTLAAAAFC